MAGKLKNQQTMKKVIIFGASGTVGKELVKQALSNKYEVTAFCRKPEELASLGKGALLSVAGDVFNAEEVENAVKGKDIVIIVLGSGKSRKSYVRSKGTENIINAMNKHAVKRLICQSTLGAKESRGNLNFFWKHIMFGWYLKQIFEDHELQETYVEQSHLDWTIVRPGSFTDGPKTKEYRHGFSANDRTVSLKISRADVAHFILEEIESDHYMHQKPGLSY